MAPISPGKSVGPPRKPRKQTQTTKSYRYEPFTKRVAKLKIDPVHKVQKTRLKGTSDDLSQSHFRSALDELSELNLTATFTSFYYRVNQLSESLPQVLYHVDDIVKFLLEHIEQQDPLALEALLSLVAHLAHDLGQEFQTYFARTVTLVAKISTQQNDPTVVEACFTCLAWMYKYLSRMLVQDLRPLLDIVLPYFVVKKEYIRRFTAESLAFLLRKTATQFSKNGKPLRDALGHILQHWENDVKNEDDTKFAETSMNLLADSAMGVDAALHSSAADLLSCLLGIADSNGDETAKAHQLIEGTLINLIHRTDANGFEPIAKLIMNDQDISAGGRNDIAARMLLVVTATRGGSRVANWQPVMQEVIRRLSAMSQVATSAHVDMQPVVKAALAILNYGPLDQILPELNRLIKAMSDSTQASHFMRFCEAFAKLNKSRFQDLVLPRLQRYIAENWTKSQHATVLLLYHLRALDCVQHISGKPGHIVMDVECEKAMQKTWSTSMAHSLQQEASVLLLARSVDFPRYPEVRKELCNHLQQSIDDVFRCGDDLSLEKRIALGWGLHLLIQLLGEDKEVVPSLLIKLAEAPEDAYRILPFVQALVAITSSVSVEDVKQSFSTRTLQILQQNLLHPSLELRKASLQLIITLHTTDEGVKQACELCLEILATEYTISNSRKISMLIRRLPQAHKTTSSDIMLAMLIPNFVMSLLPSYHDQLRRDLANALAQLMVDTQTEEAVVDRLGSWLVQSEKSRTLQHVGQKADVKDEIDTRVSAFECTRLRSLEDAFDDATDFDNPEEQINDIVRSAHTLSSTALPVQGREISLQALIEMPHIAEKRSKLLVPAFLVAQRCRASFLPLVVGDEQSINTLSPDIEESGWTLRERKLFLRLLGMFNNPKVLYRSEEVYSCLLDLLGNGDPDVRKLALQALLKWKTPVVTKHQELLLKVAEDKQTTSELALMLSMEDEARTFKGEDREAVLPLLLRLVFGQLIGRVGVHGSQEAKRKSLLRLVFRIDHAEVCEFLDIVLGPLQHVSAVNEAGHDNEHEPNMPGLDQQYGFLRMVLSMLEVLQTQYAPFTHKVVNAVLSCTASAAQKIDDTAQSENVPVMLRNIRRAGIQCLNEILLHCPDSDLSLYFDFIHGRLIQPRMRDFVAENSQGVSALLTLISLLASSTTRIACLQKDDATVLVHCWSLLQAANAKPVVRIFVLEQILVPVCKLAVEDKAISHVLRSQSQAILDSIAGLLTHQPNRDLLVAAADGVQCLLPYNSEHASDEQVLDLFTTILAEPTSRLPPHVKGRILSAIQSMTERSDASKYYRHKFYELVCSFLDFFRDAPNRLTCVTVLQHIAHEHPMLSETVDVCRNLTLQSSTQLDDIDYNRQTEAFTQTHDLVSRLEVRSFLPLLYSLIFLMRTSDDTASRGSALSCLKNLATATTDDLEDANIIRKIILQAVRKHIKDDSEVVRADFVELLGVAVNSWTSDARLQKLRPLLVGNDEEASFFTNILHIQNHRRTRAIRRLVSEVETGGIDAASITEYFLPLLQKFTDDTGATESTQATRGESIAGMTVLLQWLEWKSFRSVFRQYRQLLQNKSDDGRIDTRLLSHAADALTIAMAYKREPTSSLLATPHLAQSLPAEEVISNELMTNFIPKLAELSHYKDEGELSQRLPAAVNAIKLIKLLPEEHTASLAAPLVLDIAQVLRSRTQETRDMARNRLAEVVKILGPTSLSFVLKELRTALARGYQLHVLSYTLHTILLATAEQRRAGDLDYCVEDIVKVLLDDVFGVVGQEKENQDYISSMKEVKANKSFDSMEIVAKSTSVPYLSKLVLPFEALLSGHLNTRQIRHVDELFRRIGVGIAHSPAASTRDLLLFAYQLIQSFYKAKPPTIVRPRTNDEKNRDRYLVQKEQARQPSTASSGSMIYKLAKFAIDIARSTFARQSGLLTPENVHGFVPIIGDALVEAQDDVRISAMRLLATIIRLNMPELDTNASLYVREAVKVVKSAISTNEEAAQAALKVVAAILRERQMVEIRESDIAYLLKRTTPDLEEPDRQGVTFNLVKAVMARQLQLPEVYDLVDKLGMMMVTSQSRNSRDAARGVYIHFLLDYPQGKGRWSKQIKFLVKNLEYQYPEGRQSVMEGISTLLSKVDKGTMKELAAVIFIPAVLRMSTDDNERCREMSAALLYQMFTKASSDNIVPMLQPLRAWIEQEENVALRKVALQAWSIFFNSGSDHVEAEVHFVTEQLSPILRNTMEEDESDFQLQYQALELSKVIVTKFPQHMLVVRKKDFWGHIQTKLATTHTWLQFSASSLLGMLFADVVVGGKLILPLSVSYGLTLDEEFIVDTLRASVRLLKHQTTGADLANVVTQNLLFLARVVERNGVDIALKQIQSELVEEVEDEELPMNGYANGESTEKSIPALQYVVDQASRVLRREPLKQTSSTIRPKISYLYFLLQLVPSLSTDFLQKHTTSVTQLIVPLLYLTSPNTPTPRSSDSTFIETYTTLVEQATMVLEGLQKALGDQVYMSCVTGASKLAREKRQERTQKRAIEAVADPARSAQDKRRRHEKEKRRKKEVKGIHRGNRRKDLGF